MQTAVPTPARTPAGRGLPRRLVIADAWRALDGVAALSNRHGLPLARTVKLLLDPLVIRPAGSPQLATALIGPEAADELRARIEAAGPRLADTAAWFVQLKAGRRAAGITDGSPQDRYFQPAFELAGVHGAPGPDASGTVATMLAELHEPDRITAGTLRSFLTDPDRAAELAARIASAEPIAAVAPDPAAIADLARFLDTCAHVPDADLFDDLVRRRAGTTASAALEASGAARQLGLSDREHVVLPAVGVTASKTAMPAPFDRSILERLFSVLPTLVDAASIDDLPDLADAEVDRATAPWQLADEAGRLLVLAGRDASTALESGDDPAMSTDAAARLRARLDREAFVRRARRLPHVASEARHLREAFVRRLWVRAHGREHRHEPISAHEVWDLLDGALRSVVLDRRDRVKAAIERAALDDVGPLVGGNAA